MIGITRAVFISLLIKKDDVVKKMNTSDASAIVGGNKKKVCVVEYVGGTGGSCNAVTTCLDKHGRIVSQTIASADVANCPAGRP
jgi:orotate phosphoribosyltransferase